MDIRIKTREYQLTPDVSAYLDGRVRSIEKMLADEAEGARCEVELGRDAGRPRHGANIFFAEMHVICPGGPHVYATNHAQSINAAIDDVKEEIERQLRREKKLHIRLYRKGGAFAKRMLRFGRE